jgi:hypothetical protein
MEAEINSFTRKSKKYRTKYLDELGKLYATVHDVNPDYSLDDALKVNPIVAGQDKDRV